MYLSECVSLTIHQGAGFNLIYNIICRGVHSVFRGMYVPFVYNTEILDIVVSHLLFIIIKSYVHVISIYMFPVSYHGSLLLCYSVTLLILLYSLCLLTYIHVLVYIHVHSAFIQSCSFIHLSHSYVLLHYCIHYLSYDLINICKLALHTIDIQWTRHYRHYNY